MAIQEMAFHKDADRLKEEVNQPKVGALWLSAKTRSHRRTSRA